MKKFQELLKQIPKSSGVYIYRNRENAVIYVGKAKRLFDRVNSYFVGKKDPKTAALVKQIEHIEFFVTENETEALILENNLIKKYSPKYNIMLKDSKSYPFIKITHETIPRLYKCREKVSKNGTYFGPYVSSELADRIVITLNRTLQLRKCRKRLKPPFHASPCLNYHMNLCSAPCASIISKEEYQDRIKSAKAFLSGNIKSLILHLTRKMKSLSRELKFERAAEIRDEIVGIQKIKPDQYMQENSNENSDYVGVYLEYGAAAVSIISVRNGSVIDKKNFLFTNILENTDFREDFLRFYYLNETFFPSFIYLKEEVENRHIIEEAIGKKRGVKVRIRKPDSQKERRLTKLSIDNAAIYYEEKKLKLEKIHHLRELKKVLLLDKIPRWIECFDIATLNGKFNTAAMAVFIDGEPDRTRYRQFNIEGEGHPDDYNMMKEVIARRYQRLKIEKKEFPDLILLDGGRGQLNAAAEIIDLLGLSIPLASIAKKEEHLFIRGRKEPIVLSQNSFVLKIIQHIRDESHRFSNTRLAARYKNDSLQTQLLKIEGIGEKRAELLFQKYGAIENIKNAPLEELSKIVGIGVRPAEKIYQFYHPHNPE